MCKMHGRRGDFYCRECGEMTCDIEGCECYCFRPDMEMLMKYVCLGMVLTQAYYRWRDAQ